VYRVHLMVRTIPGTYARLANGADWSGVRESAILMPQSEFNKEPNMLWTIFVILLVLWLLGLVSSYTWEGLFTFF
jgi:hypothetical protein